MVKACKKILIFGLVFFLLSIPFSQSTIVLGKGQKNQKVEISTQEVLKLSIEFNKASTYVQRGGDYKVGEYKTFTHLGKTYRFLSSTIDTKKELISYLSKSMERSASEQFIKNNKIIEYKGKLAQVEADGGSLLEWGKATASRVKSENKSAIYKVTVPVRGSVEKQGFVIEYKYVEKIGWRISKEPRLDSHQDYTTARVIELVTMFSKAESYVQAGGQYRDGEYKTFSYNGKTYRYLSSDIDTKPELMKYLTKSMTITTSEQLIKNNGIIEHRGKLAQIEADGGSMLQWEKSEIEFIKTNDKTIFYRVIVPVRNNGEKQMYIVELQDVNKLGWRISKKPYLDLDVPGNINPAYLFINNLLVDSKVARGQFLPHSTFNVDEFKKGIQKVQFIDLKEIKRNNTQVEFILEVRVELAPSYKGALKQGENMMYFSVEPTGYMEFKIDEIGVITLF